MELTAAAAGLNKIFEAYDTLILKLLHGIANGVLTFIFKLISFIGEKGIVFFLAALILMCFSRTRKTGVCLFGAVACGALITNVILKDMIARPRPFETVDMFRQWWIDVGAPAEDGFSFPSGHVTAAAAGMMSLRLMQGRKWTVPAIVWILLMMIARNYLMVHYPSDVLVAAIIGIVSAFIAFLITRLIFEFLEDHCDKRACAMILDFDIPDFAGIPSRLGLISDEDEDESREYKAYAAARRRNGNSGYNTLFEDVDDKPKKRKAPEAYERSAKTAAKTPYEGKRVSHASSGSSAKSKSKPKAGAGYVGKHQK